MTLLKVTPCRWEEVDGEGAGRRGKYNAWLLNNRKNYKKKKNLLAAVGRVN